MQECFYMYKSVYVRHNINRMKDKNHMSIDVEIVYKIWHLVMMKFSTNLLLYLNILKATQKTQI